MDFRVQVGPLASPAADCSVAGVYAGRRLSPTAQALDAASGGAIATVLAQGDLEGDAGSSLLLQRLPGLGVPRVLLVGLGPEAEFRERRYLQAWGTAVEALGRIGTRQALCALAELPVPGRDLRWKTAQAVRAVGDGLYRFERLKSAPCPAPVLAEVVFAVRDEAEAVLARDALAPAAAVAEGVALAKDLGNLPGNLCTPTHLAELARELAQTHAHVLEASVLEHEDLQRLGMGAFLAVARGSRQAPKLIALAHRGGPADQPPVVLVGKGITFDTGGINIKPAAAMDEMKFDMCGAASVFGALRATALLRLPLNVVGLVPATENMPGGNAMKPGDVVTTMSGRTVEILDTDCEGRLVLCEALTYAERLRPAAVVDIATLTGEVAKTLGEVASGLFANDDALARELVEAGDLAWDRVWPLPLWDDYQEALHSSVADLPNLGTRDDCAVTSACFLSRFARRYPWAHLDIAGTAARSGPDKGATGRPVPLLMQWLLRRTQRQGEG